MTTLHRPCLACGKPTQGPYCAEHGGNRHTMSREQRGYGYRHRQRRKQLLPYAIGTPCPICHEPMQPDQSLDLDHTTPLITDRSSIGDRIVHATCNRRRGRGAA